MPFVWTRSHLLNQFILPRQLRAFTIRWSMSSQSIFSTSILRRCIGCEPHSSQTMIVSIICFFLLFFSVNQKRLSCCDLSCYCDGTSCVLYLAKDKKSTWLPGLSNETPWIACFLFVAIFSLLVSLEQDLPYVI